MLVLIDWPWQYVTWTLAAALSSRAIAGGIGRVRIAAENRLQINV